MTSDENGGRNGEGSVCVGDEAASWTRSRFRSTHSEAFNDHVIVVVFVFLDLCQQLDQEGRKELEENIRQIVKRKATERNRSTSTGNREGLQARTERKEKHEPSTQHRPTHYTSTTSTPTPAHRRVAIPVSLVRVVVYEIGC